MIELLGLFWPTLMGFALSMLVPPPVPLATGPAIARSPVTPPAVREFGDWTVACDNGGDCAAISLSPQLQNRLATQDPGDLARPLMRVERMAGWYNRPTIIVDLKLFGEAPTTSITSLRVSAPHDVPVATGRRRRDTFALIAQGHGEFAIAAGDVDAFFAIARQARTAFVGTASHHDHGIISLDGIVGVMMDIDRRQHRASSVTATYSIGANVVPTAAIWPPAVPTLTAVRGVGGPPVTLQALISLCPPTPAEQSSGQATVSTAEMADGSGITGLHCRDDALNPTTIWSIRHVAIMVPFASLPLENGGRLPLAPIGIPNSDFDPTTGILQSYEWQRPARDCGIWRRWLWTAGGFQLLETRMMPVCMGVAPSGWLRIWTSHQSR